MKEHNKKELAEFLWLEINRAIINSNNVRNCLKILKQMDMLDFLCQHDYILDGKKLVEKLLDEPRKVWMSRRTFRKIPWPCFWRKMSMFLAATRLWIYPKGRFPSN